MSLHSNGRFIYETPGSPMWLRTLSLVVCQLVVNLSFRRERTFSHKKREACDIKHRFTMMITQNQVITIHSGPGNLKTFHCERDEGDIKSWPALDFNTRNVNASR